ncbi:MAG TPA: 30S ribosomal protein S16 [Candidatus Paceibacterota bacterium]|nr:30S ribosomal protein S16 [Candidatus Paceibacterota bacterium]
MLKIRMQRIGRINMPSYRLIVVEHTESPKTGRFTDIVGTYNPRSKEKKLDEAKIKEWISKGAQPSDTVHNMLVSAGIIKGKKINILPAYKAPVVEEAPAAEATPETAPSETPTEAPAEAPAEEPAAPAPAEAPAAEPAPEAAPSETPAETPAQ